MKSRVFDFKLLHSHITFSSKRGIFSLGLVLKKGVGNVRTAFGSPEDDHEVSTCLVPVQRFPRPSR